MKWDDPLPRDTEAQWLTYRSNLVRIEDIRIPRCVVPVNTKFRELLGFCDASEKAYAAVVYLRTTSEGQRYVHLITSKTRVAPAKTVSLPRLELCGALLLAHVIESAQDTLQLPMTKFRHGQIRRWCWAGLMQNRYRPRPLWPTASPRYTKFLHRMSGNT